METGFGAKSKPPRGTSFTTFAFFQPTKYSLRCKIFFFCMESAAAIKLTGLALSLILSLTFLPQKRGGTTTNFENSRALRSKLLASDTELDSRKRYVNLTPSLSLSGLKTLSTQERRRASEVGGEESVRLKES